MYPFQLETPKRDGERVERARVGGVDAQREVDAASIAQVKCQSLRLQHNR